MSNHLLRGTLGAITEKGNDMGWYLKKSFGFGPLRLNLSKSGIGASVGVKGLRVSAGPKGRQLNAGREGLYYRSSLNSAPQPHEANPAHADLPKADPTLDDPIAEMPIRSGGQEKNRLFKAGASAVGLYLGYQLARAFFGGLFKGR